MSNNLKLINTNTINSKPIRNYIKVKNTGGPKGDTGATGATGPQGPQGPAGQAATINIGETTTLLPGQTATVTNTGTQQNATLNFGIPQGLRGPTGAQGPKGDTGPQGLKGDKGNDGAAASVAVGITNTGEPGSNASVTNLGTSSNAILSFTIPTGSRGPQGQTGPQGPKGEDGKDGEKGDKGDAGQAATVTVGSTTTTNPGTSATVTNSGTTSAAVLNFGIPRGATGSVKSEVVAELPETGEGDTFYLVNREATTQTATGKTINFTNSENSGDTTDAQIDGETSQQTYTGKNLLDYPSITQTTRNGITSSYDANTQTIMFNGTCDTDNTTFAFEDFMGFQANGTYTISYELVSGTITNPTVNTRIQFQDSNHGWSGIVVQLVQGNNSNTGNLSSLTFTLANVRFDAGVAVNNYKIRVQFEKSNQATSWEQYVGGIPSPNPDYPQPVNTVNGQNRISITGKNWYNPTKTQSGTSITYSADTQYLYVNGSPSANSGLNFGNWFLPKGTYKIMFELVEGSITTTTSTGGIFSFFGSGLSTQPAQVYLTSDNKKASMLVEVTEDIYNAHVQVWARATETYTNAKIACQVVKGSADDYDFEPFMGLEDYLVDLTTGKNLINPDIMQVGYVTADGTKYQNDATGDRVTPLMSIKPNTEYTFEIFQTSSSYQNWIGYCEFDKDFKVIGSRHVLQDSTYYTFTTSSNAKYLLLSSRNLAAATQYQLSEGGRTTFEPYTSIELRKIDTYAGTYQDYIYKSGGDWYIHKATKKLIYNGTEAWNSWYNIGDCIGFYNYSVDDAAVIGGESAVNNALWCNMFSEPTTRYSIVDGSTEGIKQCGGAGRQYMALGINKSRLSDYSTSANAIASLKTWLAANPTTVYCTLATPTDTEITNSTLIEQLDNLASAALYSGVNNIFTITPNEVPTLELDYVTYDKYNQNKVYIYNEATGVWQIIVQ